MYAGLDDFYIDYHDEQQVGFDMDLLQKPQKYPKWLVNLHDIPQGTIHTVNWCTYLIIISSHMMSDVSVSILLGSDCRDMLNQNDSFMGIGF